MVNIRTEHLVYWDDLQLWLRSWYAHICTILSKTHQDLSAGKLLLFMQLMMLNSWWGYHFSHQQLAFICSWQITGSCHHILFTQQFRNRKQTQSIKMQDINCLHFFSTICRPEDQKNKCVRIDDHIIILVWVKHITNMHSMISYSTYFCVMISEYILVIICRIRQYHKLLSCFMVFDNVCFKWCVIVYIILV